MNDDGQLRAAHLILDYEPISRTFLDVGNSIRANEEEEEMAPKTGPSLRELMKSRNKVPSSQDKKKSKPPVNPPPPLPYQLPANLGLKPNPDLRRKRHIEAPEEGEMAPSKGSKQPRQS